ncbi:hypothetical protein ABIA22_003174 [Sinorhizobium fredii]
MHIDGQCHCGCVTYEAEIDPEDVSICHCTDCQRLTGSAYRVTAGAPRASFRLTGGEPKLYVKDRRERAQTPAILLPALRLAGLYDRDGRGRGRDRHPRRDDQPAAGTPAPVADLVLLRPALGGRHRRVAGATTGLNT